MKISFVGLVFVWIFFGVITFGSFNAWEKKEFGKDLGSKNFYERTCNESAFLAIWGPFALVSVSLVHGLPTDLDYSCSGPQGRYPE